MTQARAHRKDLVRVKENHPKFSSMPEESLSTLVPTFRQLRRLIDKHMLTDADLDAFLVDYYKETVFKRLSRGMERKEKITILFAHIGVDEIFQNLCNAEPAAQDWHSDSSVAPELFRSTFERTGGAWFTILNAVYAATKPELCDLEKIKFDLHFSKSEKGSFLDNVFLRELVLDLRKLSSDPFLTLELATPNTNALRLSASRQGYENIVDSFSQRSVFLLGNLKILNINYLKKLTIEKNYALIFTFGIILLVALKYIMKYLRFTH